MVGGIERGSRLEREGRGWKTAKEWIGRTVFGKQRGL